MERREAGKKWVETCPFQSEHTGLKGTFSGKAQWMVDHEQVSEMILWLQDTWLLTARVILTLPPGIRMFSIGIYSIISMRSVNRKLLWGRS